MIEGSKCVEWIIFTSSSLIKCLAMWLFKAFGSEEAGPDLKYMDFKSKRSPMTPVSDHTVVKDTFHGSAPQTVSLGNSLQLVFSQLLDGMQSPRSQLILEVSKSSEFFRNAGTRCHRTAFGMVVLLCKVEGSLTGQQLTALFKCGAVLLTCSVHKNTFSWHNVNIEQSFFC